MSNVKLFERLIELIGGREPGLLDLLLCSLEVEEEEVPLYIDLLLQLDKLTEPFCPMELKKTIYDPVKVKGLIQRSHLIPDFQARRRKAYESHFPNLYEEFLAMRSVL